MKNHELINIVLELAHILIDAFFSDSFLLPFLDALDLLPTAYQFLVHLSVLIQELNQIMVVLFVELLLRSTQIVCFLFAEFEKFLGFLEGHVPFVYFLDFQVL